MESKLEVGRPSGKLKCPPNSCIIIVIIMMIIFMMMIIIMIIMSIDDDHDEGVARMRGWKATEHNW